MSNNKINWEEIEGLVDGNYRVFFEQIEPELLEMVLDERNREQVKASVSRMLLMQYPEEATAEMVEELVGMMERVARKLNSKEPMNKVAILLPGYLDSPNYQHMMIFQKRLQELGYLVERVDPCLLWETGDINNYTITNFLKQIEARVNLYKQQEYLDILLLGHSQGAMVAIIAGAKFPAVTKIVALCPPNNRNDSLSKWDENGIRVSKRDLPDNPCEFREFAVPLAYINDASQYSASDYVKSLHKPLMIFIALDDEVVAPEKTELIVQNAHKPYVIRQPNIGHDFRYSKNESELVMARIEEFLINAK